MPHPPATGTAVDSEQLRLFVPALAAFSVSTHWCYPDGWMLVVAYRREGDENFTSRRYPACSTDELWHIIGAVLEDLTKAPR